MQLLAELLRADPAGPRLTVYDESTDSRLDFSALTLDNWAAKVANMLYEELDLEPAATITIDLPAGWQAAVIALGALAAGIDYRFGPPDLSSPEVIFCSTDRIPEGTPPAGSYPDLVVVTADPFGRGVVETGGTLPEGAIDFGPTVRFYSDDFPGPTPGLADLVDGPLPQPGTRLLSTGWTDRDSFTRTVLGPLAAGGSAVIVAGVTDVARLDDIARAEKVTDRA